MRKTLIALFVAVALLIPAATPVLAADPTCFPSTRISNKIAVIKDYRTNPGDALFYFVDGEATVRDLQNCTGTGLGQYHGIAVLPANMQGSSGIYQLGWQEAQLYGRRFILAHESESAIPWPGNWTPQLGLRYRFEILINSTQDWVFYKITKVETGTFESYYMSGAPSHANLPSLAWWGYEQLDNKSGIGPVHGLELVRMSRMRYKYMGLSVPLIRTDIDKADPDDYYRDAGLESCYHGHVQDTTYNNDTLSADGESGCGE